jgi:hypothetical protein
VSEGQKFKLWIPPKNQFFVGDSDAVRPSSQPLANLRPQVIYNSLLLQSVDRQSELAVLEEGDHSVIDPRTQRQFLLPDYTLDILGQNGHGWYLSRKTVFDRTDLQPHRQILYDEHGSIVTDVFYDQFEEFDGILFPTSIRIWRPQEEYSIQLKVTKLTINGAITDDQFVLEPPSGAGLALR